MGSVRHLSAFPYCFCCASGEIVMFATVSRLGRLGKRRRRTHRRGRHAPSAVQQAGRTDGRTNVSGLLFLDDKLFGRAPGNLLVDQSVSPPVARTVSTPASPAPAAHPPPHRCPAAPRPYGRSAAAVCRSVRGPWPSSPSCWPLLVYGGREIYLRFTHIYEYDARVTADIVTISSRADGWVVDMPVREGMRVEAGQVVARIDDRAAKLKSRCAQGPDRRRAGRAHAAAGPSAG